MNKTHTSGETYFFRDRGQFDLLHQHILPELVERRRDAKSLRFWSAGCASGEEAYSLAILIDLILPARNDWQIVIVASDVNPAALAKTEQGLYGEWSFRQGPLELRKRYFRREGVRWRLDDHIRKMVTVRSVDLIEDVFPAGELQDMDLILCRNVFIYFEPAEVESVAKKLAASIREGGYLMTAHAELIGLAIDGFQTRLFPGSIVYQRRAHPIATQPEAQTHTRDDSVKARPPAKTETRNPPNAIGLPPTEKLLDSARILADRGAYDGAEGLCRQAIRQTPLAPEPYLLLAQLDQLRGRSEQAVAWLEKTLYLDPNCVVAALELAALYDRGRQSARARMLRRAALAVVRDMPPEQAIAPYETTAADLVRWLSQYETT